MSGRSEADARSRAMAPAAAGQAPPGPCGWSARELRAAYVARRVSPVEVLDAVLAQIERVDAELSAFFLVTAELAREQARQAEAAYLRGATGPPLLGIPVSVKDLIPTAGTVTTYGSAIFEHHVPDRDAPAVERLRDAGALLLGKTATSEFGWKSPAASPLFGATRNPWDLRCTTAGSSGGAAAAVATGMGPLAIGTDGGGSIRQPASFCGVVGLKASAGLVPAAPPSVIGTIDNTGPLGRTVRDVALALDVLAGSDPRDWASIPRDPAGYLDGAEGGIAGLRVALSTDLGYAACDPGVAGTVVAAARAFEDLGCVVEEAHPGWDDPAEVFHDLCFDLFASTLAEHLPAWEERMDPGLVAMVRAAGRKTTAQHARALQRRIELHERALAFFERFDLLVTPTMTVPPFELGIERPSHVAGRPVAGMQWTAFTFPFNLIGHPAVSVPAGWTPDGLPVGLQIVGPWRADRMVLRAAAAYEAANGWAGAWPPIAAASASAARVPQERPA